MNTTKSEGIVLNKENKTLDQKHVPTFGNSKNEIKPSHNIIENSFIRLKPQDCKNNQDSLFCIYRLAEQGEGYVISRVTGTYIDHKSKEEKSIYRFSFYRDLKQVWKVMQQMTEAQRTYFEVARGSKLQRMHFDLDMEGATEEEANILKDKAIEEVQKIIPFTLEQVVLSSSHSQKKKSFHIVIHGYKMQYETCKAIYKLVASAVNDSRIDHAVYKSIQQWRMLGSTKYNANRHKKFVEQWQYKGTTVNSKFSGYTDEYKLYASVIESNDIVGGEVFFALPEKVKTVAPVRQTIYDADVTRIERMMLDKMGDIYRVDKVEAGRIDLKRVRPGHCIQCNREHQNEHAYITVSVNGKVYFRCRRAEKGSVELGKVTGEVIESKEGQEEDYGEFSFGDVKIYVDKDGKQIAAPPVKPEIKVLETIVKQSLQSTRPTMKKILNKAERAAVLRKQVEGWKKNVNNVPMTMPHYVNLHEVKQDVLRNYDMNDKTGEEEIKNLHIVRSSMDTQKTRRMYDTVRAFLQATQMRVVDMKKHRVVFLSCRQSLAGDSSANLRKELGQVFTELGITFENYLDVQSGDINIETFNGADCVFISAESLHLLQLNYDMVVIDEITSFLPQMNSNLHREFLDVNWEVLVELHDKADRVLYMDADIDERAIGFLHRMRPNERIDVTWNNFQRAAHLDMKAVIKDSNDWDKSLIADLKEGKNIFIVVDSDTQGKVIQQLIDDHYGDLEILPQQVLYTFGKKGTREKAKIFSDLNRYVVEGKYRVFMTTSTLTVGVDFNRNYFHRCYVCAMNVICARDLKQMIGRVRYLEDRMVIVTFDLARHRSKKQETVEGIQRVFQARINRSAEIMKELNMHTKMDLEILNKYYNHKAIKLVKGQTGRRMLSMDFDHVRTWLSIENLKEVNISNNRLQEMIIKNFISQGYTIKVDSCGGSTNKEHKNASKKINKYEIDRWDETPVLNKEQLKMLEQADKNGETSTGEKVLITKMRFLSQFREDAQIHVKGLIYNWRVKINIQGLKRLKLYEAGADCVVALREDPDYADDPTAVRAVGTRILIARAIFKLLECEPLRDFRYTRNNLQKLEVNNLLDVFMSMDMTIHTEQDCKSVTYKMKSLLKWFGLESSAQKARIKGIRTYYYEICFPVIGGGKDEREIQSKDVYNMLKSYTYCVNNRNCVTLPHHSNITNSLSKQLTLSVAEQYDLQNQHYSDVQQSVRYRSDIIALTIVGSTKPGLVLNIIK